jgi:DNA ligase-associated metallophosphoesterase
MRMQAQHLVFLGDVFHARTSRPPSVLAELKGWRERHSDLHILLVRGNHDHAAGDPPKDLEIECVEGPVHRFPFVFQHEPSKSTKGYTLSGHVHPSVRLSGDAGQSLKLPCFFFGRQWGILPAFGSFTGTAIVKPRLGDRVYVIVEDEVIAVAA